jgi:hypothetical protein
MRKEQVCTMLMKTIFLGLQQKGLNLDKEEGNFDVEGEPIDDSKVAIAPINSKSTMNISQLLKYYTSIRS